MSTLRLLLSSKTLACLFRNASETNFLKTKNKIDTSRLYKSVRCTHEQLDRDLYEKHYISEFKKKPDIHKVHLLIWQYYRQDVAPTAELVCCMLEACHANNDFPMAVRCLELCRNKFIAQENAYEYILTVIKPTLERINMPTLEQLGI